MTLLDRLQTWAPGALAALLLILSPVKYRVHWVDGPPQGMSGWPLPWMADSMVSSARFVIYLAPLAINLALLLAVAWLLMRWVRLVGPPIRRIIVVAVWVVAAPLLAWTIFITAAVSILVPSMTRYQLWYPDYGVQWIEGPFSGRSSG